MRLNDNAGWHKVADDRDYDQDRIPDFAIGLVLFEPLYEQKAKQQTDRDGTNG
jgi:hypothetical protein